MWSIIVQWSKVECLDSSYRVVCTVVYRAMDGSRYAVVWYIAGL